MMKRWFLVVVSVLFSFVASAQNNRVVRGVVFDDTRKPMAGVVILADMSGEKTETLRDGTFQISIPQFSKKITASLDGFISHSLEVDGSYLVFTLKVDKDYAKRLAAQRQLREKEIADSLALVKKARQLREKEIADSLALVKKKMRKAEKERLEANSVRQKAVSDSLAQATKTARKAEKEHLAADVVREKESQRTETERRNIERRRAEFAKDSIADLEAKRISAVKKSARKNAIAEYDRKYRNHGLVNSFELSYGYQLYVWSAVFQNSGKRKYGDLTPLQATWSIGYSFGYIGSLSVGAGILYNVRTPLVIGDSLIPEYGDFKEHRLDVPVFLNGKIYMTRTGIQPMLSVSGGIYAISRVPLADIGLGVNFRAGNRCSAYLLANFDFTPWPLFQTAGKAEIVAASVRYIYAPTVGVKAGFTF